MASSLFEEVLLSTLIKCSIHLSTNLLLSVKMVVLSAIKRGAMAERTSAVRLSQMSCSSRSFCCTMHESMFLVFAVYVSYIDYAALAYADTYHVQ